jgi:hypothetical protein
VRPLLAITPQAHSPACGGCPLPGKVAAELAGLAIETKTYIVAFWRVDVLANAKYFLLGRKGDGTLWELAAARRARRRSLTTVSRLDAFEIDKDSVIHRRSPRYCSRVRTRPRHRLHGDLWRLRCAERAARPGCAVRFCLLH